MAERGRGAIATFVLASLVDAVGTGCFLGGSALFLTRTAGLDAAQVGAGLSLAAVAGLLVTVPVGRLADRHGPKPVLLTLLLIRAGGFALYALVGSFPAFLAVAVLLGMAEKPTSPAQQALIAAVVGDGERQRTLALTRAVRNVGFGAGAGLAALLVLPGSPVGLPGVVLCNAVSFLLSGLLLARVPAARPARPAGRPPARPRLLADRGYLRLTALNGLLTLHMALLSTGIPLWLLTATDLPAFWLPVLVVLNTVVAALAQVPVAQRVRDAAGAVSMLRVAGLSLGGCCLLLALLPGMTGAAVAAGIAVTAVLALTVAELTQAAGGWDLSFRRADPERQGAYLSVFSLGVTTQTIAGPVLLTALVLPAGAAGWAVLAALLAVAGLAAPMLVRESFREAISPGRGDHSEKAPESLSGCPAAAPLNGVSG
ncbi:MFS family permease [Actinoplanes octamycinicus]|uniref:MFS family permease n=1 Tax=Actinoplanes octamycinicus TaxID=135948 RepID=A0A7W7GVQ5_9ACTN|nr:MFS transporter [Actinoplanes octamycinicus]MBB4739148.1 MFS family permease [Actinoplanes octamycinicus]GIE58877.1 membrane protein [Actinoplanes octamycinicus]